jgi:hypothetical protein
MSQLPLSAPSPRCPTLSRTLPLTIGPRRRPAPPVSRSRTTSVVPRRSPLFAQQRCRLRPPAGVRYQPPHVADRYAGPLSLLLPPPRGCAHVDHPFFPLPDRATEPISFKTNVGRHPVPISLFPLSSMLEAPESRATFMGQPPRSSRAPGPVSRRSLAGAAALPPLPRCTAL